MAAACTSDFFLERELFFSLISKTVASHDVTVLDPLVKQMCEIVDKYQEQPHLLDPHLEGAVSPVMARVRKELRDWHERRSNAIGAAAFSMQAFSNPPLHKLLCLIYQLCKVRGYKHVVKIFPHEVADVEPCVQALVCQDVTDHKTWEMRYVLLLWLSILVLIPFPLNTLDSFSYSGKDGASNKGIVLTILDLCKGFLSDPGAVRNAAAVCISRLITRPDLDKNHLQSYLEWSIETLAACNARVGAPNESDFDGNSLDAVSSTPITTSLSSSSPSSSSISSRIFLATGVLTSLVEIAKHGHRDTLVEVLGDTYVRVSAISSSAADAADGKSTSESSAIVAGYRGTGLKSSPLLRRLIVKLAARTGLTFLPPRIVAWRYSRGARSLIDNLSQAGVTTSKLPAFERTTIIGSSSSSSSASTASRGALLKTGNASLKDAMNDDAAESANVEDDNEDGANVPAEIEDILDMLLQGLRDTDTVVRWSSAKGVGRVTGRLPRDFADDVVAAVLQLLTSQESDTAWHGGCLALAELARRGLLLPSRLPVVMPLVLQALRYDIRRGAHSVGTHVRDAACYVCWAFARAYAPSVMRPYVLKLAQGMLITSLFDREVNCRRAASAAFQENVGRQGHDNFPHGIEILTAADYFTLGNRLNSFLVVAPVVGSFRTYRYALVEHLLDFKLKHWDKDVRELSARALAKLAGRDPNWAIEIAFPAILPLVVSPDLFVRHGAILAIAELALSLAQMAPGLRLPNTLLDSIRNVVVVAEKARVYTGRGGEMVRSAMCRLIECQCLAGHVISRKAALRMLLTIDDCLKHPNDLIQASAVSALRALSAHALSDPETAVLDKLTKSYTTRVSDENPAVRRGSALALGSLPRSLLTVYSNPAILSNVIAALCKATEPEALVYKRDAETRRNAAISLCDVVSAVGFGEYSAVTVPELISKNSFDSKISEQASSSSSTSSLRPGSGLSSEQLAKVWDALLNATRDYATDNRGDVGSWVRKAAIESLERIAVLLQAAIWQRRAIVRNIGSLREYITEGKREKYESTVSAVEELRILVCNDACAASGSGVARLELLQHSSGYGNITGYGAGVRLLAGSDGSALFNRIDASVADNGLRRGQSVFTSYGIGVVAAVSAGRTLCDVEFPKSSLGRACFPYGQASINTLRLSPGLSKETAISCGLLAPESVSNEEHSSESKRLYEILTVLSLGLSQSSVTIPVEDVSNFITDVMLTRMINALLRQASEKLDLMRAVAGDALCRLLQLPRPIPQFLGIPQRSRLEQVFPEPNWNAGEKQSSVTMSAGTDFGVDDESGEEDDKNEKENSAALQERETQQGLSSESSIAIASTTGPRSSSLIQWAIPHQCFPRITQLLGLKEYTASLIEGLVTAVGGLSESVVKHSSTALTTWAAETKKAGELKTEDLAVVADALLLLVKPRPKLSWELSSNTGQIGADVSSASGTSQGFDPSLQRWFKEILGGGGGSKSGNQTSSTTSTSVDITATHRVDVRVIVPALRTTDILLASGGLDALQPSQYSWPLDMLVMVRRRVEKSREDVGRVLAAAGLYLGLLHFSPPASQNAALAILDLLCHPFPRVRKTTADKLYVRLLSLEPASFGTSQDSIDEAAQLITETVWDEPFSSRLLDARDALYPKFNLTPPEGRMGTSAQDHAMASGEGRSGAGGGGGDAGDEDFSSYGALYRASGY
jgi:HEAT repeat protein